MPTTRWQTKTSRRNALRILAGAASWRAAAQEPAALRLAISESVVPAVNLNDARAALQVWVRRITGRMNLRVELGSRVIDNSQEVLGWIRHGRVDAAALNVSEYRQVTGFLDPGQIVVQEDGGQHQHLIVVRSDAGIRKLADLRGRRMIVLQGPGTFLARAWVSTLLARDGLIDGGRFFGATTAAPKASQAVLPVFFGQAAACLTSASSLRTMAELNPQLGRQLMALETSPELVATFYVFRRNYDHPNRQALIQALAGLRTTAGGRQLLMLFQVEGLAVRSADCLKNSLAVLAGTENGRLAVASREKTA